MAGKERGLILQHSDEAPPGILGEWLAERGIPFDVVHNQRDPLPPDPAEYGWIASLGSEHTPGTASAPQWVGEEVDFMRRALAADVPVLGLCFGGQTLALAAGGSVHASDPPEVGWLEVETGDPDLIGAGPWLHFHFDLLEPPAGSRVIARSPAGPAAFVLGRSLGLQFHPESTGEIGGTWARMDAERLGPLGIDASVFGTEPESAREGAFALFDSWWKGAGVRAEDGMGTLSKIAESAIGEEI